MLCIRKTRTLILANFSVCFCFFFSWWVISRQKHHKENKKVIRLSQSCHLYENSLPNF